MATSDGFTIPTDFTALFEISLPESTYPDGCPQDFEQLDALTLSSSSGETQRLEFPDGPKYCPGDLGDRTATIVASPVQ